jgi:hypothetical protein
MAHYHRECFWRGEIPLWNPLNNCGIPFLAQWAPMALYPLTLIYLLLSPLSWSLGLFCLVHLWWGALGMYYLAYGLTRNRFGAAVAGLALCFNGFSLNCLMWPNYLAALGWMPWVVCSAWRAWEEGGRRILIAGLIGALQMLAGAPELIFFTWLLAGGLWLCDVFRKEASPLRMFCRLFTVILIVAGLAAAQLLPFLDLLGQSQRGSNFSDGKWSMPVWGWANLLVPLFRTFQTSGVFFQENQFITSSYYIGVGILVLVLAAVWKVRERRIGVAAALAALGLVLALGNEGYVYGWLRQAVPALGFMRYPVKFVMLMILTVPLLAAAGLDSLLQSMEKAKTQVLRRLIVLGTLLLLLMAGIVCFAYFRPLPSEKWTITFQSGLTRSLLLIVILGTLCAMACTTRLKQRMLLQCLILLLVWMDILSHAPRQNPTVEPSVYAPLEPLQSQASKPVLGESRAVHSVEARKGFYDLGPTNLAHSYIGRRLGLDRNCNLLEGIPTADGFHPIYLNEERAIYQRLHETNGQPRRPLADFLGGRWVTARGNILEWDVSTNYMPLVTGGQRPVFADRERTLAGLMSSNFAPRELVFLPLAARSTMTISNRAPIQCVQEKISAHRIEVHTRADTPAMVVIAQTFYPHWHAYVDGKEVKLWRANHAFQALEVPQGHHLIKLIYQDRAFLLGAFISAITILIGGLSWFWLGRKRINESFVHVV